PPTCDRASRVHDSLFFSINQTFNQSHAGSAPLLAPILAETKIKLTRKEKGAKEKMQTTRTEALSLYRELQRCSRQFPYEQARTPLSLDVRELFMPRRGVTSNS